MKNMIKVRHLDVWDIMFLPKRKKEEDPFNLVTGIINLFLIEAYFALLVYGVWKIFF